MRRVLLGIILFGVPLCCPFHAAAQQVDMDLPAASKLLSDYFVAIDEYFQVSQKQVLIIRKQRIRNEQIPVVLFVANKGDVNPQRVVDLRLRGIDWLAIAARFGLNAETFHVPVKDAKFDNTPREGWKKILLTDDDIINLVNLRFLSEHYKRAPEEILKLRAEGKTFMEINQSLQPK